ncbi:MAG: DNA/RNA non-specific endonuclease [Rickettsiaceae bacterium]|nr:DNA/RNA non-specific endonuclease [Rickettsiaceae bacterium]
MHKLFINNRINIIIFNKITGLAKKLSALFLILIATLSCSYETDDKEVNSSVIDTATVLEQITSDLCFNNKCPTNMAKDNFTIKHDIFVLSLNRKTKFADWVAYKVVPQNLSGAYKERKWRSDPKLSDAEYALTPTDYKHAYATCGYDRGHLAPLASFSNHISARKTNYLSNITPQLAKLNRGAWKKLEDRIRLLAREYDGEVYIMTGSYYTGKTICKLPSAKLEHVVPNGFWKIVILKNDDNIKYSSFYFTQEATDKNYCNYSTSIEKLQQLTSLNFPSITTIRTQPLLEELGCQ